VGADGSEEKEIKKKRNEKKKNSTLLRREISSHRGWSHRLRRTRIWERKEKLKREQKR
jgi:hypothetical protein